MKTRTVITALIFTFLFAGFATKSEAVDFQNLYAPKTFSFGRFSGNHVKVKLRVSTHSYTNPTNRFCRMRVRLVRQNGSLAATRVFLFNNNTQTKYIKINEYFLDGVWRVLVYPMDNARFQGSVNLYSH